MTAITTIWKKSRAAVFYAISLGLAALAFLFHAATPRKRPAARHAAPHDDGQDWADVLRKIPSPLRRRKVSPLVTGQMTVAAVMHAHALRQQAMNADLAPSHADLDQYLTEGAKRYPAAFDAAHRILDGEIAPPWIGPQVGDITLDAPMTYRPEPPLRPLPPARACPDVAQASTFEGLLTDPCEQFDTHSEVAAKLLAAREDAVLALVAAHVCHICGESWDNPTNDCACTRGPQDVPGPAETASPPPPSGNGAEAALPPAVASAGPGTTRPDVDDLDNTGVMAALTDWALHAPLDQVRAVAS